MCREFRAASVDQISRLDILKVYTTPVSESWRAPFLHELTGLRDGYASTDLTRAELNNIIDYVCCS